MIFYTYAGYPLLVFSLVKLKNMLKKERIYPPVGFLPVTLIVAAFNEEKSIKSKISNCLKLDYPPGLLKLVFVTDGSTDNTPSIISEYQGITLLHQPARKGKPDAISRALSQANTPIAIFSDANTFMNSDSVKSIVRHYADPSVGAVAGEKRIMKSADSVGQGEGLYWRYESLLKKLDSDLKTTVGAAGELFSIRTELFTPLPEDTLLEDFVQSMLVCTKGYVVRYEPGAFAEEAASPSLKDELERKIRISAGAFQAIGRIKSLFNFFRYPMVCFQLVSHRILRWTLCPLALVVLLVCSVFLYFGSGSVFYEIILFFQVIIYISAISGWQLALKNKQIRVLNIPFYFVFMNFCVFAGFLRFIRKKQTVLWQRAERQD
ncbi:MAG: glycosyltransferase family 2 protein [Chitinophagaceae bacterium]|nr:glycosyltransferase family 2 protein [Chitinophagaceae bacterium]